MITDVTKKAFAHTLQKCGVNTFFTRLHKSKTKILLYHAVVKKEDFNPALDPADQCLTDEEFEKQTSFLSRNYSVIGLDDFLHLEYDHDKTNIIITFDDGFLNNYTTAYPILKRHDLKATFFITTSFISGEEKPWFLKVGQEMKKSMRNLSFQSFEQKLMGLTKESNQDEKCDYFQPMTWEHVKELSQDPMISMGSHCKTHYPLTILPHEKMRDEIAGSKEIIEMNLGKKVDYVSYPHGMFNDGAIATTKEAGYKAALTTIGGFNDVDTDPYRLKRNSIGHRGDLDILSSVISGSWDFFRRG